MAVNRPRTSARVAGDDSAIGLVDISGLQYPIVDIKVIIVKTQT